MITVPAKRMKLFELIEMLQALADSDPDLLNENVFASGCDCVNPLNGVFEIHGDGIYLGVEIE